MKMVDDDDDEMFNGMLNRQNCVRLASSQEPFDITQHVKL